MNAPRPLAIWGGALAALALLIVLLHEILLPFIAGLALAYLLAPMVDNIERIGINRTVAAIGIFGLFAVGVAGVLLMVVPLLGTELVAFVEKVPDYIGRLQAFANDPSRLWLRKLIGEGLTEAEQSAGQIAEFAADWIPTFLRSLWSDSQAILSILSLMIVTPIVTIYLLIDWKDLVAAIDNAIPAEEREHTLALANELNETIAGFLRGQGAICLVLATYYALALWVIGLNHGILIGIAAGLISFIPYLGSFIGLFLSLCVVVLQFWPDWTLVLVVAGIFLIGQSIADYVLAPYLIASRVHLNPVWVMFAIAAFGYLFGFVGLLIAVPAAAAIGVVIRFAVREYRLGAIETLPVPPPPPSPPPAGPVRRPRNWLKAVLGK
jgi:predicted PurR-regulated permease PerM